MNADLTKKRHLNRKDAKNAKKIKNKTYYWFNPKDLNLKTAFEPQRRKERKESQKQNILVYPKALSF
jgi:hypothetical protein